MGKRYDKPAIIGTTPIEPKGSSCQQGDEASKSDSTPEPRPGELTGGPARPRDRRHVRLVRKEIPRRHR